MKWVILGAGRSGIGAKNLLEFHKQLVFLFDEQPLKLPPEVRPMAIDDVNHPIFSEKDLKIVVSPGISLEHLIVKRARTLNQEIISEIDLALRFFDGKLIAVTGTNGKSTTVMMIECLLRQLEFDFALGGNIGIAASSLMMGDPHEYLVLELSSYQIEASQLLRPRVAVLTGLSPDHISRHKTIKGYLEAKWRIFENQRVDDLAIIEEKVYHQAIDEFHLAKPRAQVLIVRESDLPLLNNKLKFHWKHDQFNAYFALQTAAFLTHKSIQDLAPLLKNYLGLPFRCEVIAKLDSWSIVNDSKGTNMDSTLHALSNTNGKITLFLGGLGKGESFTDILKFSNDIEKIVAFGKSHSQIQKELANNIPVVIYPTLKEAMDSIQETLKNLHGDLIFSPACASQDEFSDFEERGNFFTQCVHKALKNIPGGIAFEPIFKTKKS